MNEFFLWLGIVVLWVVFWTQILNVLQNRWRANAVPEAVKLGVTGQCQCNNVEMGSYDNQRTIPVPIHMAYYKRCRLNHGLQPFISVDRCCVPELVLLWKNGIHTYGCCCGHGKAHPYINVSEGQFWAALSLGFKPYQYPNDPKRKDAVYWPTI